MRPKGSIIIFNETCKQVSLACDSINNLIKY